MRAVDDQSGRAIDATISVEWRSSAYMCFGARERPESDAAWRELSWLSRTLVNGTAVSFSSYTVSYDKVVACCACNLEGAGRDRDNG